MGGPGATRMMTWSLDKKRSCNIINLTYLAIGTCSPSLPVLAAHLKPLHLCSAMLRMMSLMKAMHLWEVCTKARGDSWWGERSSLLLFVMLLLVVADVMVVVTL